MTDTPEMHSAASHEQERSSPRRVWAVALVLLGLSQHAAAGHIDTFDCGHEVPRDLAAKLATSEPGEAVPSIQDLDPDSVAYARKAGGSGCYAVAKGSFEGPTAESIAMLLRRPDGSPDLMVATRRNLAWSITHLPTFCDDIKYCYVDRGNPGVYVRSEDLDAPITDPSERAELTSEHDVVISGHVESTGITYVKQSGHWLHVWTSD